MKTAELIGPALDWAVSYALGYNPSKDFHSHGMTWHGWWETAAYIDTKPNEYRRIPRYSTDWSQGGPIIERERIALILLPSPNYTSNKEWNYWSASVVTHSVTGPTPLIAAMRCYVASKLGDEVDIPEELCTQMNPS